MSSARYGFKWRVAAAVWVGVLSVGQSAAQDRLSLWQPFGKCEGRVERSYPAISCDTVRTAIDAFKADAKELSLTLPDGQQVLATRSREPRVDDGRFVWRGTIDRSGTATFSVVGKTLVGGFSLPDGRRFRLRLERNGVHALEELDPRSFLLQEPPLRAPASAPRTTSGSSVTAATKVCATDDGHVIDVLVAYTQAARVQASDASAVAAQVSIAESETNWSLSDSAISGLQIRVVQIKEVAYVEPTGSNAANDVWDEMVNPNGLLKQLHQWRDDFGADVVILVPDMSGFSGSTGFTFQSSMVSHPAALEFRAFSIVPWTSLTIPDAYFLTHELGHVMGAQHEDTAPGNPFTFSRAIISPPANSGSAPGPKGDPDGCIRGWKTIMATSNNCGSCMTLGQWSTPDARHQHCGKLMGERNSRDNAETIRKTTWTVANVRCSKSPPPSASGRPIRNGRN